MEVLKYAYQHPLFTNEDLQQIFDAHEQVNLAKGEFILEKGAVSNEYYILADGLTRTFLYDYEGNEITTGFTGNNEVVIEVASIFQRIPTQEYIQCLTDCTLWKIDYDIFQELFHKIPAFREWGRAWMAFELYLSKKRATEMITEPAKNRYLHLMEEKPQIIQQAPLKYIASYLGVTDSSLSRIRKEILQA
ncbi:Crp/Fnr family transcriptional regulator [Sphingobacterium lactis]|uniref:cAMP-binding domain of CRP or a regulatory subunit of cAMP-dependent protein kinases n=1 Tax=Sphingobacterium lactis TaxID=797291 RepID=A0A1H5Z7J0_9SPHI|nr:Crp/Fnr family transcriptional regulator [Sphingobacterium lactis]SEG31655.1 cAMP-binding domain of CRP or a regulatory subunit of cAMP-dependent protein kinases [Sphingobacterium lactis]